MRDGYIRLGDPTTSGGNVLTASALLFTSEGKPVALEGDEALCPMHGGTFKIVGGDPGMTILGRRAATEHLSKLACGCGLTVLGRDAFARVEPVGGTRTEGVGAYAGGTYTSTVAPADEKSISEIYWTFGPNEIRIESDSRFYVDLNLHVLTRNYHPGETVQITIEGADGEGVSQQKSMMAMNAVVGEDGVAKILNVFGDTRVEIYARN